jgi:hypothetical protein
MRWGPQTSPAAKASENERTKRNHAYLMFRHWWAWNMAMAQSVSPV